MQEQARQTVESINAKLAALLDQAHEALRGEQEFGVENIRELQVTMEIMAPILAQSHDLRGSQPEIIPQLDRYKSLLKDLQTTTQQLQVMLLGTQTQLHTSENQNVAVSRWVSALRETR